MKKKQYMVPAISVREIDTEAIICASDPLYGGEGEDVTPQGKAQDFWEQD